MPDVALDNTLEGAGNALFAQTKFTFNFTMGTVANGILLIWVGSVAATTVSGAAAVTSISYGGQAMTLLDSFVAGNCALYFLANPPFGVNAVQVNVNSAYKVVTYYVASFANALQTAPTVFTENTNSAASAVLVSNLTTTVDRAWAACCVYQPTNAGSTITAGAGFTSRQGAAGIRGGDSGGVITPAASYNMSVSTPGGNTLLVSIMVQVAPVPVVGGTARMLGLMGVGQ